jgi:hypothetical protein
MQFFLLYWGDSFTRFRGGGLLMRGISRLHKSQNFCVSSNMQYSIQYDGLILDFFLHFQQKYPWDLFIPSKSTENSEKNFLTQRPLHHWVPSFWFMHYIRVQNFFHLFLLLLKGM